MYTATQSGVSTIDVADAHADVGCIANMMSRLLTLYMFVFHRDMRRGLSAFGVCQFAGLKAVHGSTTPALPHDRSFFGCHWRGNVNMQQDYHII